MEPTSAFEAGEAFGRVFLASLLILAFLGGGIFFIVALVKAFKRKTPGWIVAAVISGIVAMIGLVGSIGLAAQGVAKGVLAMKAEAGKKKRITAKGGGYGLEVPGDWKEMPELNEVAGVVAGQVFREQYVMVIENSKADFVGSLAEFDEQSTSLLAGNLTGSDISKREARNIGSYSAMQGRITGRMENVSLVYQCVSVETEHAYYQILAWTLPSREATARPVFEEIFDSFSVDGSVAVSGDQPEGKPAAGDTREMVTAIIGELLDIPLSRIKPGDRFAEDLGADSLDSVELVMAVEDEFHITITDETAAGLKTVDDLVTQVERQIKKEE